MEQGLEEKKVTSTEVYRGSFLRIYQDKVLLPDGREASREYVKHPGATAVVPITSDGRIVLVRQYRYPVGKVTLEIPAGKLDAEEEPLICAKRELKEETGALEFEIKTFCDYSVQSDDKINYGRVLVANITLLGELPDSEIGEVIISKELPEKWTYPEIQKKFIERYIKK